MLTAFIPLIAKIVVSTSAGVAIESAVQMIVPIGTSALPAFGIKVGTALASAIVGAKIGKLVESNLADVIITVMQTGTQEEPAQEEN